MQTHNQPQTNRTESRRNILAGIFMGIFLGITFGWIKQNIVVGLAMGIPLGIAIGYVLDRRIPTMRMPAFRLRRILYALITFLVFMNVSLFLPDQAGDQWNIYILPLTILAGIWFIMATGKGIASLDEMQRRIQTEAIAIGFALLAVVALGYGLAGILVGAPQVNWLFFLAAMPLCWLVGKVWTLKRYGQ